MPDSKWPYKKTAEQSTGLENLLLISSDSTALGADFGAKR